MFKKTIQSLFEWSFLHRRGKNMKKFKKICYLLLVLFAVSFTTITLVSCSPEEEIVEVAWEKDVKFENTSFEYDGNPHSILVKGAPEGAKIGRAHV